MRLSGKLMVSEDEDDDLVPEEPVESVGLDEEGLLAGYGIPQGCSR